MADRHDHNESDANLRVAAVAGNEPEAAIVCGLLGEAGIRTMTKLGIGGGALGSSAWGSRSIYVREDDLARAREVLAQAQGESSS